MSGKALWVPLDVNFLWDPSVNACEIPAQILFVRGLCLAKQTASNGFIGRMQVAQLCWDMNDGGDEAVAQLLREHLWLEADGGYEIRSWLKHNKSAEELEELSKTRAAAGRKGGKANAKQVASATGKQNQAEVEKSRGRVEGEGEKRTSATAAAVSPEANRLARVLAGQIQTRDPKANVNPNLWAKDIDKLIRLDGRDPADIERVICWCQQDTFWQSNILSGKKLREKFTELYGKSRATSNGNGRGNTRESLEDATAEFLARHQ